MQIIFVAINDATLAWYEMLVPFILSLKKTSYDGHIAVIAYGLTQRKREILENSGIIVISKPETSKDLLTVDRYRSVANFISEHNEYTVAAIYDADIWFSDPKFDLFERLEDAGKIYAAKDRFFSSFIFDPITGPNVQYQKAAIISALEALECPALQAGLLAGRREAWGRFGERTEDVIGKIGGEYSLVFGLDTTLLHLQAADGDVALLPTRYNCPVYMGVSHTDPVKHDGEWVSGLHVSGNVRINDELKYVVRHSADALERGREFIFESLPPYDDQMERSKLPSQQDMLSAGLEIVAVRAHQPIAAEIDAEGWEGKEGALVVRARGSAEVTLRAVRDLPKIEINRFHPVQTAIPASIGIRLGGADHVLPWAGGVGVTLPRGGEFTVFSRALNPLGSRICWSFGT